MPVRSYFDVMLEVLAALFEAGHRTINWMFGILRGGRNIIWKSAASLLKSNLWMLAIVILFAACLGFQQFTVSTSISSSALLVLGDDVTAFSRLWKVGRVFVGPADELFVGAMLSVFFVIALLKGAVNYFISQLNNLL